MCGFGYSINRKHAAMIANLVFLAGGLDELREAMWAISKNGACDLRELVQYLTRI